MHKHGFTPILSYIALLLLVAMAPACYKGGRVEVRAVPPEAYVYLNGTPEGPSTASAFNDIIVENLTPGEYKLGVYNYGYKPEERTLTVQEGKRLILMWNMVRKLDRFRNLLGASLWKDLPMRRFS